MDSFRSPTFTEFEPTLPQLSRQAVRYLSAEFKKHNRTFRAQQALETFTLLTAGTGLMLASVNQTDSRLLKGDDILMDCVLYFKYAVCRQVVC